MKKRSKTKIQSGSRSSLSKTPVRKRAGDVEDFTISEETKKQIIGFILFVLGLLLFFTIISYSAKDDTTLERISVLDIFKKETYSAMFPIINWLGLAGAFTAKVFVANLFGYFSVIFSLVLVATGISLALKKSFLRIINFSLYASLLGVVLASITGLLRILIPGKFSVTFSGTTGDYLASVFYKTIGGIGASVVFVFLLSTVLFLLFDSNIIKTLARVKFLLDRLMASYRKEKEDIETKIIEKTERKQKEDSDTGKESSVMEAVKKEREKIQKLKYGKDAAEEEESLIKETEIKRPKPDERTVKTKKAKDQKEVKLDDLLTGKPKKGELSEIEVNPENSNELAGMESREEDDFVEEKLESYIPPELGLLDEPSVEENELTSDDELNLNGKLLQEKLLKFGIQIEKVFATPGPVVTLYELIPAADVKLSKIESLQDDIALAMKARGIRMIIPIPGKGTVGVEIPNRKAQMVKIRSILDSAKYNDSKLRLPVAFGKTIDGEIFIDDLYKMPHVLIAGATGSGKSVGINTIIASLLYKMHPSDLKFVMIDPKKIELSLYSKLRMHFIATTTDINESIVTSPSNAVTILKSLEMEMEQRYDKLANAGVRNIESYNVKYADGLLKNNDTIRHRKMPYIVVIIDELADLMITAKREIEDPIARIAQMARAVGIHLIVATQRPSVDVITGVIKANFPVRIAYQVASKIDSRTILDMGGADQLLRNGDMLYQSSSAPKPIRIQNAYISTEECERIVDFIGAQKGFSKPYLLPSIVEKRSYEGYDDDRDELFVEAVRLVLRLQQCSTSTLQRRLKLGYARAARIVDQMEQAGIVGPNQGAKGREILLSEDDLDDLL